MMIPTTLATMSRKESKLNGISRFGRRRRIMTVSPDYLPGLKLVPGVFVRIPVHTAHGHLEGFKSRISQVIAPQPVRTDQEAYLGAVRWLARTDRGLSSGDQSTDRFLKDVGLPGLIKDCYRDGRSGG